MRIKSLKLKKRSYLHIIPNLRSGGAESFLLRLIEEIPYDHYVLTLYNTAKDRSRIRDLNLTYITFDPLRTRPHDFYLFFKCIFRLTRNDRIFSWLYVSDLLASLIKIFFKPNVPLVWNIRNTIISKKDYSFLAYYSFLLCRKFFLKIPYKIVFNSTEAYNQHIEAGYYKNKSLVIYNGFKRLDIITNVSSPQGDLNFICVARYHPQKNHRLLLDSLGIFKKSCTNNFILNLVGQDMNANNKELINLIESNNLISNVILHGVVSAKEVHQMFSKCDMSFLLSKFGESFPNVIAESMLYGTIPISTNVGDSSFIISNHGRVLNTNVEAIDVSLTIQELFKIKTESPSLWSEMVKNCENFSRNRFSISEIANSFVDL